MTEAAVAQDAPIPGSFLAECLGTWRKGDGEAVLRQLAATAIQRHARADKLMHSRNESSKAAAVLKEFLGQLIDPERDLCLNDLVTRFPNCVHALVVRAEIAMAKGRIAEAISDLKSALAIRYDDLHAQRLLIEAYRLLPPAARPPEIETALNSLEGRFCNKPFSHFETTPSGDVYVCCPSYLPLPIGNIGDASWDDIWNSTVAQEVRRSIHDGDFRYCSRLSCPAIQSSALPIKASLLEPPPEEDTSERLQRHTNIVSRAVRVTHGPSFVNLSHDRSCNLTCPSCRTKLMVAKQSEQEKLDIVRDKVVLPALKTATGVLITGSGDPFGSKHFRDVLDHLNPADFPNLQVNLQTNGQLFTEREWNRLTGLHSMIRQVYISIDAATEATYGDVRRGGSFAKLCANMGFISALRHSGRIKQLVIAFVVQACNFRQMTAFVELGREWRVDRISFSRLRQWGTYPADEFRRRDVCSADHPDHAALLDVLRSPVFRENFVWLGNMGSLRPNPVDSAASIGVIPNNPDSLDF